MQQDLIGSLEDAPVCEELKAALEDLVQEVESLLPDLTRGQRWRARHPLERVVTEALDPAADTHWWEAHLDLVVKAAGECDPAGRRVIGAAERLAPLMRARMGPDDEVTLREITEDTVRGICDLSDTLALPRKEFVAPNAISLAQAHFNKYAWFRAIYAGKAPVGFVMIVDDPDTPDYFLWRFMIGGPYQGRGYGRQAIRRLVEYVRTRPGAKELVTSCGEGEGSPKEFYLKQGFVPAGEVIDEETVLRLPLVQTEGTGSV